LEEEGAITTRERMNGKYLSISVQAVVRAPELFPIVWERLWALEGVMMKF
jgi:putative lipoic acid-binding regulatory protein